MIVQQLAIRSRYKQPDQACDRTLPDYATHTGGQAFHRHPDILPAWKRTPAKHLKQGHTGVKTAAISSEVVSRLDYVPTRRPGRKSASIGYPSPDPLATPCACTHYCLEYGSQNTGHLRATSCTSWRSCSHQHRGTNRHEQKKGATKLLARKAEHAPLSAARPPRGRLRLFSPNRPTQPGTLPYTHKVEHACQDTQRHGLDPPRHER